MTHTEKVMDKIEWLLNESGLTYYHINIETGIAKNTLARLMKGESKVENIPLATALKLENYVRKLEEEAKMENKINEIIAGVESFKVELDNEYDIHEVREEEYISHWVEGEELEVYFAEKQFVKDAREEGTVEELLERLNDLEDRFDYDKVVAYDAGSGIMWL